LLSGGIRQSSWLEIFFDLAFVLAAAQLALSARALDSHRRALGFAFLVLAVCGPPGWGFPYFADLVDVDSTVYYTVMLGAMLPSIACLSPS
jgi:low temperature requirement protein LtrA